jgi:hypothetical protein
MIIPSLFAEKATRRTLWRYHSKTDRSEAERHTKLGDLEGTV